MDFAFNSILAGLLRSIVSISPILNFPPSVGKPPDGLVGFASASGSPKTRTPPSFISEESCSPKYHTINT